MLRGSFHNSFTCFKSKTTMWVYFYLFSINCIFIFSPVCLCSLYSTERFSTFVQVRFPNVLLWSVFPVPLQLWTVSLASMFACLFSTSLYKTCDCPGNWTQSLRSRHQCRCPRKMYLQSRRHRTSRNLKTTVYISHSNPSTVSNNITLVES